METERKHNEAMLRKEIEVAEQKVSSAHDEANDLKEKIMQLKQEKSTVNSSLKELELQVAF